MQLLTVDKHIVNSLQITIQPLTLAFIILNTISILLSAVVAIYAFILENYLRKQLPENSLDKFAWSLIGTILMCTYYIIAVFQTLHPFWRELLLEMILCVGEFLATVPVIVQINQINIKMTGLKAIALPFKRVWNPLTIQGYWWKLSVVLFFIYLVICVPEGVFLGLLYEDQARKQDIYIKLYIGFYIILAVFVLILNSLHFVAAILFMKNGNELTRVLGTLQLLLAIVTMVNITLCDTISAIEVNLKYYKIIKGREISLLMTAKDILFDCLAIVSAVITYFVSLSMKRSCITIKSIILEQQDCLEHLANSQYTE